MRIFLKSIVFFAFLYVVDFLFRAFFLAYIGIWSGNIGTLESNTQIWQTFINGSRYFGQIVGVLSLIVFVLLLFCQRRDFGDSSDSNSSDSSDSAKILSDSSTPNLINRIFCVILRIFIALILTSIAFVNIANMGFYQIYGDTFNANLLGLIFDDRGAIFRTAFAGQYNLSLKIIAWIALSVALTITINAIFRKIDSLHLANLSARFRHAQGALAFALFLLFGFATLFAINGHFGLKGISLGKEIRPVGNTFLRQITTGAFRDLYIVILGYRKIAHSKFSDYIEGESPIVVAQKFGESESLGKNSDIDLLKLLSKRVQSRNDSSQIEHIFYIIAESMSEWHFDSAFDSLGLSSELKKLAKEKGGFKADIFLQNAGSTIKSLDVQISGLLQTDIPLSLLSGRFDNIKFAPAVIMRDLGFEGTFFYGGSGTWQKLDSYVTTQGFSEILFGTHIVENATRNGYPAPYQNAWGAYDHHLFAFVRDTITAKSQANPSAKTFNVIMTTSNHPPYDAPLAQFNAPLQAIESFVESTPSLKRKATTAQILAHIWYQDKVIARFVREMSAKFPRSLFIITGDHYDREYIFTPSVKIAQSVPFIVYAPTLKPTIIANIGSHIDITPTIIELVAPKSYEYPSFGKPMLRNANRGDLSLANRIALGFDKVANDRFIYDGYLVEYFNKQGDKARANDKAKADDKTEADALFMHLKRAKALSWWIYKNGYTIPHNGESKAK